LEAGEGEEGGKKGSFFAKKGTAQKKALTPPYERTRPQGKVKEKKVRIPTQQKRVGIVLNRLPPKRV